MDEFFFEFAVYLIAQMVDIDVDDIRAGIEVVMPNMLGDDRAAQDFVCVPHKIFKERVFLSGQFDEVLSPCRSVRDKVECQVGNGQRGRFFRPAPPQQRANAGE